MAENRALEDAEVAVDPHAVGAELAIPKEEDAKEVEGNTRTLFYHIHELQDIEAPNLLSFNDWQKWRKHCAEDPTSVTARVNAMSSVWYQLVSHFKRNHMDIS